MEVIFIIAALLAKLTLAAAVVLLPIAVGYAFNVGPWSKRVAYGALLLPWMLIVIPLIQHSSARGNLWNFFLHADLAACFRLVLMWFAVDFIERVLRSAFVKKGPVAQADVRVADEDIGDRRSGAQDPVQK